MWMFSEIDTPLTVLGKRHPMDTRVTFNMKEIKRLQLIKQIVDKQMTAPQAAELLGLSL
jgi:hypothetical protein